jgi:hypothetical protein
MDLNEGETMNLLVNEMAKLGRTDLETLQIYVEKLIRKADLASCLAIGPWGQFYRGGKEPWWLSQATPEQRAEYEYRAEQHESIKQKEY